MREASARRGGRLKHYLREIQAFPASYNNSHRPKALWLARTNAIALATVNAPMRARP